MPITPIAVLSCAGHGTGYLYSKLARAGNKTRNADDGPATTTQEVPMASTTTVTPVAAPVPTANTAHLQEGPLTRGVDPASPNVIRT